MNDQHPLRFLSDRKPVWRRPDDAVVDEVIIPSLQVADTFDCMVGFFSGAALRELAPGLAAFIVRSREPLRLLVSPVIPEKDQKAVLAGTKRPNEVLEAAIAAAMSDEIALRSALAQHSRRCLAYLIATRRLQMKVVLLKGAIFHVKEWIFRCGDDVAVLSGSANFTAEALTRNVEQLHLHRNWRGEDSAIACQDALEEFARYWANEKPYAVAVDLPLAVREGLVRSYPGEHPPTEDDYRKALCLEGLDPRSARRAMSVPASVSAVFAPPPGLVWETGLYAHQGKAVFAWEGAGRRGILAMATGAGKTITALVAAWRLFRECRRLLVIVSAPTRPLVSQWADEVRAFGLEPYAAGTDTTEQRLRQVESRIARLELSVTPVEVVVVTSDLLNQAGFRTALAKYRGPVLLIGDEVHNLGTEAFLSSPPESVQYRLGLSATPEKQYDEEGTRRLFEYFGPQVFEFGLAEAIGLCLVPYDYHVHPVSLSPIELAKYRKLSNKIRSFYPRAGGTVSTEDKLQMQKLLNRRRLVLETAEGKIEALRGVLAAIPPSKIEHALIYATDKAPSQLDQVNRLLDEMRVSFHQVTAAETGRAQLMADTLNAFRDGHIQALTAKRVLDEGLNVPEISAAFILASTTVKRQWVQRRGRVLRLCPATRKQYAVIHDFIVLPPPNEPCDDDVKRLIEGELKRCDEFASIARNRAAKNGPRDVLQAVRLTYVL